jgi:hypothetical protein
MGGMFTAVKIREGLAAGDYSDPGPYQHPQGTVAYEVQAAPAAEPPLRGDAPVVRPATKDTSKAHH